jgi:hypothetical protein
MLYRLQTSLFFPAGPLGIRTNLQIPPRVHPQLQEALVAKLIFFSEAVQAGFEPHLAAVQIQVFI